MSSGVETVTVCVPGSTSNCGAGFDSLGLALQIYNRITLRRRVGDASGCGRPQRGSDERAVDLVAGAARAFFAATGVVSEGFEFQIEGEIPSARGLGSSATVIVGVLAGLDTLHGTGLARRRLLEIGTVLEGNPENVAGAVLGGFTVSRTRPETGEFVDAIHVAVPASLSFVVASPAVEMPTKASRGVLPANVSHRDAAKSVNSAAYLAAAFVAGEFEKLPQAVTDFLHEPYRLPRIPGARAAITAGVAAGALTGWLSGSGSSVLCVSRPTESDVVATAMRAAFVEAGVGCVVRVLVADNAGFRVESAVRS